MRIILYLGKGGVGKTTVAAATAVRSAELGYRTLVASTDIAHSLADSFDIPLDDKPKEIEYGKWVLPNNLICPFFDFILKVPKTNKTFFGQEVYKG